MVRESAAKGVDAGGLGLRNVLKGRGSGGKDVRGACVIVGELEAGVVGGELGSGATPVGGGATGKSTGGRGGSGSVADDGVGCRASGRNDRRFEDNSVVWEGGGNPGTC